MYASDKVNFDTSSVVQLSNHRTLMRKKKKKHLSNSFSSATLQNNRKNPHLSSTTGIIREYLLREAQVKLWIERVLSIKLNSPNLYEHLSNGVILCELLLKLDKTSIPEIHNESSIDYKLRENVQFFLQGMEEYGVPKNFIFQPNDLINKKNMNRVISSLFKLSDIASSKGFSIPIPNKFEVNTPLLSRLEDEHRKIAIQLTDINKSKSVLPIVPPRRTTVSLYGNPTGIIKFQALVRGHLERKQFNIIKRHNAYRSKVANEILDTEERYVESISICIAKFLNPLQDPIHSGAPELSKNTIRTIFSDLKIISSFHEENILKSIKPRVENWNIYQTLGDIFLQLISVMKIYTQYISNYSNSRTLLSELTKSDDFKNWKQKQERSIGGISLSSLLIMPVQRIPRYVLLLSDLYKHTWPRHPDYKNLLEASDKLKDLTEFLDTKEREAEYSNLVATLTEQIRGKINLNLHEAHRKLIREDKFNETTYVYLFNDILLILNNYKKSDKNKKDKWRLSRSEDTNVTNVIVNYYWIRNIIIEEYDNGFNILDASSRSNVLTVSGNDSKDWINSFTAQQKKNRRNTRNRVQISSGPRVLLRDDSYIQLKKQHDVVRTHLVKLEQMNTTGKLKRKEKKQLQEIKHAVLAEATLLEDQIQKKRSDKLRRSTSQEIISVQWKSAKRKINNPYINK